MCRNELSVSACLVSYIQKFPSIFGALIWDNRNEHEICRLTLTANAIIVQLRRFANTVKTANFRQALCGPKTRRRCTEINS